MQQTEATAGSLGSYLRSLRESRGSSLEDMARSTRVGIRHLEALEEERLADLPSPVFVRGFIRAYCGFLREAPEAALGHYQELAGERAAAEAASAPPRPRTTWATSSVLMGIGLLIVLGAGLLVLNLVMKRTGGTSVAATKIESLVPPPAAPATPVVPVVPTVPTTPVPAVPAPPPAAPIAQVPPKPSAAPAAIPEPTRSASTPAAAPIPPRSVAAKAAPGLTTQHLVIKAVEATWVRVQTDDGRVVEELLPAGASREWATERRFLVTIGNAGGVEVVLNGKSLPALGAKGTPIHRLELPGPATASGS